MFPYKFVGRLRSFQVSSGVSNRTNFYSTVFLGRLFWITYGRLRL